MAKIYKIAFVFMLSLKFYCHECFNPYPCKSLPNGNHNILLSSTSLIDFQLFFCFIYISATLCNTKQKAAVLSYGNHLHLQGEIWFITFEYFHNKLSNNIKCACPDTSATNNKLSFPSNKQVVSIMTTWGHLHLLTAKIMSQLLFYGFRNHKTA